MNIIEIHNLNKVYNFNVKALNNVSIFIKKGEFFALLGKNGAGKSTTIGILTSLIKKTGGKIFVKGFDFDFNNIDIKMLIGFVPQDFNFNQFETVLDIIINQAGYYGIKRDIALLESEYYLKLFDLWDKKNIVSINLSGGYKRRLMMIRALIHKPIILILDEPTAGVDIITRRLIWKFLKKLNYDGTTVLLTTHYLDEVEFLCDSVAIIDKGNILIKTNVNSLLSKVKRQTIILEADIKNINKDILNNMKSNFIILNNTFLEINLTKENTLNDTLKFFVNNNIKIYSIKNKYNKLEELFIDLVN